MRSAMVFQKLKTAIEFLTIFKLGKSTEDINREGFADSIMFFPLVGLFLGGFCATAEILLKDLVASDLARSLFAVIILALFTKGLHLDGVADCFDALHFARHDKEKALQVMKGKTIGAFGASALIVVIVGKLVAISAIPGVIRIESLLLIPALSRWTSSIVAWERAPASAEGLGFIFSVYSTRKAFLISGVIALVLSILLLGMKGVLIFVFVSILALFLSSFFNRSFGGITGDVFGAVIELSEVFGFLLVGIVLG